MFSLLEWLPSLLKWNHGNNDIIVDGLCYFLINLKYRSTSEPPSHNMYASRKDASNRVKASVGSIAAISFKLKSTVFYVEDVMLWFLLCSVKIRLFREAHCCVIFIFLGCGDNITFRFELLSPYENTLTIQQNLGGVVIADPWLRTPGTIFI